MPVQTSQRSYEVPPPSKNEGTHPASATGTTGSEKVTMRDLRDFVPGQGAAGLGVEMVKRRVALLGTLLGESQAGRLCLAVWENVFERPDTVAQEWAEHLVGPEVERRLNAARLQTYNRPADCWAADDGERVGSAGG